MDFNLSQEQLAWRDEIRSFFREALTPELREELWANNNEFCGPLEEEYQKKFAAKGWYGLNWPKEYGGLEKGAIDQNLMLLETLYHDAPQPPQSSTIQGPVIMHHGTEENKKMWLPPIVKSEISFCLGYSEPNSGTDLASLTTRAELVGDEWVINGTKMWTTHAQRATHIWLLARTDRTAPKHKGLSLIIVPKTLPGVTVNSIHTWSEVVTFEVVLDNVRVPKNYLIGEENKGWGYVMDALDRERLMMANSMDQRRVFEELVGLCNHMVLDGEVLAHRPDVRMRIAELAMDLEVARLFSWSVACRLESGQQLSAEASMAKVFTTELRAKLTDWGSQIIELYGQLNKDDAVAPLRGHMESMYRRAPYQRFGGGTNEVQRDIIAQRGLGLLRAR